MAAVGGGRGKDRVLDNIAGTVGKREFELAAWLGNE